MLEKGFQPNRDGLHKVLTGDEDKQYEAERSLIGRVHYISAPRLSGILDMLLFLGLITHYKNTKLLEITELGKSIFQMQRNLTRKRINLSKVLEIGASKARAQVEASKKEEKK